MVLNWQRFLGFYQTTARLPNNKNKHPGVELVPQCEDLNEEHVELPRHTVRGNPIPHSLFFSPPPSSSLPPRHPFFPSHSPSLHFLPPVTKPGVFSTPLDFWKVKSVPCSFYRHKSCFSRLISFYYTAFKWPVVCERTTLACFFYTWQAPSSYTWSLQLVLERVSSVSAGSCNAIQQ